MITHQKRTMEVGDALYGVTMRGDGVSTVISQRLRESSQLLVITHQKRTMEVGDALYGVTMRGDGVSAVISQRLRETQSA